MPQRPRFGDVSDTLNYVAEEMAIQIQFPFGFLSFVWCYMQCGSEIPVPMRYILGDNV
jgi:hypothetical protein